MQVWIISNSFQVLYKSVIEIFRKNKDDVRRDVLHEYSSDWSSQSKILSHLYFSGIHFLSRIHVNSFGAQDFPHDVPEHEKEPLIHTLYNNNNNRPNCGNNDSTTPTTMPCVWIFDNIPKNWFNILYYTVNL